MDSRSKEVAPAKWPHLSLLARLYAGVQITSYEAQTIFSTLSHTVDTLRYSLSEKRIEQMIYLRLNAGYN